MAVCGCRELGDSMRPAHRMRHGHRRDERNSPRGQPPRGTERPTECADPNRGARSSPGFQWPAPSVPARAAGRRVGWRSNRGPGSPRAVLACTSRAPSVESRHCSAPATRCANSSRRRPGHLRARGAHRRVSRAWLYNQPDIRQAVQRLRAAHRPTNGDPVPGSQRASNASLLRRLEAAHARNRELAAQIRELRDQLARAHGQLRAARLVPGPLGQAAGASPP
jgi:hypothetical protein